MNILYTYSLVPVISIALLLALESLFSGRKIKGMALYCLAVACWAGILFLSQLPGWQHLQVRFCAFGVVVSAAHVHGMFDLMEWEGRLIVLFGYGVSLSLLIGSVCMPALLSHELALRSGPWSLPAMAVAGLMAMLPFEALDRHEELDDTQRRRLSLLIMAGVLCFIGGWGTILLLSNDVASPYGPISMLVSLLIVGHLLNLERAPHEHRLLERSFVYTTIAALLSAGFLFVVLWFFSLSKGPRADGSHTQTQEYTLSVLFLFFMAALAFEPIRQYVSRQVGQRLLRNRTPMITIAENYAAQERRADQAERLAELGSFVSAVAHEVRNPLGVLAAYLRLLERQGVDEETRRVMQQQIDRANHFISDLLSYGRPRPLSLRRIELQTLLELAMSTAKDGLRSSPPEVTFAIEADTAEIHIEGDQSQLLQVFVILLENAMLAQLEGAQEQARILATLSQGQEQVSLKLEDDGPGVPTDHKDEVFRPFFTTRKRDETLMSSGLGLAIAKSIVERHHGTIEIGSSRWGGACVSLTLPHQQRVLAATPGTHNDKEET